ncbi:MAG: segregation/condensation protein A [Chitinispirillia bacterium]|nr:segregation/condensation protein A [Chitinispirillia bacterium]MCL2269238.1 segregation/condensation protein A [Chitinispirillia bacterium]
MSKQQEYEVHLDLFDGPLDLLLYLVHKAEVNIVDIKVSEIAEQYIGYLDVMRDLNIDVAGEYLNMAATLVRLKARELLPDSPPEEFDGGEFGISNREQLIAMMLEYEKYKLAGGTLKEFETRTFGAYARGRAEDAEGLMAPADEGDGVILGSVSIFDLITAFKNMMERVASEVDANHVVVVDNCRIDDRIEHILTVISDIGREMRFEELFADDQRKIALVVTFMALLELVKMRQIKFRQESAFGEIFVIRSDGSD